MEYNPNQEYQSPATTKLCIEHALSYCKSQKILALEIDEKESRISEMKKGITRLRTSKTELIFKKYGYPRGSKSIYFPMTKVISSAADLTDCLQARENLLQSIIFQDLVILYRDMLNIESSNDADRENIEYLLNELIFDDIFVSFSRILVTEYFKENNSIWHGEVFEVNQSKLTKMSLEKGECKEYKAIVERINSLFLTDEFPSFGTDTVNIDDAFKLSMAMLISVAANITKVNRNCVLVTWDRKPNNIEHVDHVAEVQVNGITIAEEDCFEGGLGRPVYLDKNPRLKNKCCLASLILELRKKLSNCLPTSRIRYPFPEIAEIDLFLNLNEVRVIYNTHTVNLP
ncbi:hypothetical protein [Alteromonas sp. RKMC-009]|uniref:hypothetical protein n=1 Tax=Alteromonas sp. RKMC-009 TaxID=2267264 RepID=UPI000F0C3391|nr:hypothetical protein [Alteromonas sp. RKMC-009]AYN07625.1 hypothetical protein DS731_21760 [Alteromonas sp. RKMC-009]